MKSLIFGLMLALPSGTHSIMIKAWDGSRINWSEGENITVR